MPEAAPEPASPTKCPLPILLANRDAPTYKNRELMNLGMMPFLVAMILICSKVQCPVTHNCQLSTILPIGQIQQSMIIYTSKISYIAHKMKFVIG